MPTQARSFKLTDRDLAELDELGRLLNHGHDATRTATLKAVVRDRLEAERKRAAKKTEKVSR